MTDAVRPHFTFDDQIHEQGWVEHFDMDIFDVRVFVRDQETVTLIHRPEYWDIVYSNGAGHVQFSSLRGDNVVLYLDELEWIPKEPPSDVEQAHGEQPSNA